MPYANAAGGQGCVMWRSEGRTTYLQLLNRNSQVSAGRNGRRNCRVIGRTSPSMSMAAANVFAKGPGASDTDSEKMATMASIRYWPSYIDHWCVRSDRSVSAGEKDVSREASDDVGDCLLRIRERVALHFLRTRCGMKLGRAASPGIFFAPDSMSWVELSRNARYDLFMATVTGGGRAGSRPRARRSCGEALQDSGGRQVHATTAGGLAGGSVLAEKTSEAVGAREGEKKGSGRSRIMKDGQWKSAEACRPGCAKLRTN